MATEAAVRRMLGFLYGSGLDFPPSGDREDILDAWADMLDEVPDGGLMHAARQWQRNGNTRWPKPEQVRTLIAEAVKRDAEARQAAQGLQGCACCDWTGTRTVIRHRLLMKWPRTGRASFWSTETRCWELGALHISDVEIIQGWFNSDDHDDHREVEGWVAQNRHMAAIDYRTFVVACGCEGGLNYTTYPAYTTFQTSRYPTRPPQNWHIPKPVACRQYVTGTRNRYHPDDTRSVVAGTEGPVRWFNQPSPEETRGPVHGPHFRAVAQRGLEDSVAAEMMALTQQTDAHAAVRAKQVQRAGRGA